MKKKGENIIDRGVCCMCTLISYWNDRTNSEESQLKKNSEQIGPLRMPRALESIVRFQMSALQVPRLRYQVLVDSKADHNTLDPGWGLHELQHKRALHRQRARWRCRQLAILVPHGANDPQVHGEDTRSTSCRIIEVSCGAPLEHDSHRVRTWSSCRDWYMARGRRPRWPDMKELTDIIVDALFKADPVDVVRSRETKTDETFKARSRNNNKHA